MEPPKSHLGYRLRIILLLVLCILGLGYGGYLVLGGTLLKKGGTEYCNVYNSDSYSAKITPELKPLKQLEIDNTNIKKPAIGKNTCLPQSQAGCDLIYGKDTTTANGTPTPGVTSPEVECVPNPGFCQFNSLSYAINADIAKNPASNILCMPTNQKGCNILHGEGVSKFTTGKDYLTPNTCTI